MSNSFETQPRWWWMPLALIALTLVLLGAVPFVTNQRVAALRRHAWDVTLPALVLVNDLEASLATQTAADEELAAVGPVVGRDARTDSYEARRATEIDERSLDSLVRAIGPEAVVRFDSARAAISAWQSLDARCLAQGHPTSGGCSGMARWSALRRALLSTRWLEDELTARSNDTRVEIRRIEEVSLLVPFALVPAALLALAAVIWTAARTRALARAAHEGRLSAERARESKETLMRGVTHDLKNPLGAAAGYAELLGEGIIGPLPEAQARIVTRLRGLLATTLATVNDLLELSRAEASGLRVERVSADLGLVVQDAVEDYRASAAADGISLVLDRASKATDAPTATGESFALETDPARVRQVLGNLLSNAVKYTPRNGEVRVRIDPVTDDVLGDALAIRVTDNGPGIPPALRDRVFDEFFRVETTRAAAPGTGVGLTTARRVARLLGGDLRLDDGDGPGAVFILLLPVGRVGTAMERVAAQGTAAGPRALASSGATPLASSSISHSSTETGRLP